MTLHIPILRGQDQKQVIGWAEEVDGNLLIEFAPNERFNKEEIFQLFGT